jgi:hypothetical protein
MTVLNVINASKQNDKVPTKNASSVFTEFVLVHSLQAKFL